MVIGYSSDDLAASSEQPLEEFAAHLNHPLVIVGPDESDRFLLNQAAQTWLDDLQLPDGSWTAIESAVPVNS